MIVCLELLTFRKCAFKEKQYNIMEIEMFSTNNYVWIMNYDYEYYTISMNYVIMFNLKCYVMILSFWCLSKLMNLGCGIY